MAARVHIQHINQNIAANPRHVKTENLFTFRHKIFYLKHLVLTDTHIPTDNCPHRLPWTESRCLELHYIIVHHSSRSKTTMSQKCRCYPVKYLNHIKPVTVPLASETFLQMLRIYNCQCIIAAANTEKCLKEGILEQGWYKCMVMQEEQSR